MALNDDDAALVGSYAGTFFFGIYLVIAAECSKLLYRRYKTGHGHTYLATTHVLLFVFISARCLVVAYRAMSAFKHANIIKGNSNMGNYATPMSVVVAVLFVLDVLVYDAFLIFRTSVVWNHSVIVIVIPGLATLADLATGIWLIYLAATFKPPRGLPIDIVTVVTIFSSLTAFVNVVCSGLIAYRILGVTHQNSGVKVDNSFTRVVALVVESAAVTCLVSLCIVITVVVRSFSMFIFTDISGPTIGIVFCSIVIRVSQGRSRCESTRATSHALRWNFTTNEDPEMATSTGDVPVHFDRAVHTESESENSGEDQNLHRSTSKNAQVPPPELPDLEKAVIKSEAY